MSQKISSERPASKSPLGFRSKIDIKLIDKRLPPPEMPQLLTGVVN